MQGRLSSSVLYPAQVVGLAVLYVLSAKLSLRLAIPPGYATPVWPPAGIALAALLLCGWRVWPGVWLGAAIANFAVESSLLSAALIGAGNSLEAVAAAMLIARRRCDPRELSRPEDVVSFIAICAVAATIAPSAACLAFGFGDSLSWVLAFRNWWTWWQGDLAGMVIVGPLLLSWSARSEISWPAAKKLEAAVFALLLAAAALAIVADDAERYAPFSLSFIALPFILWAAIRFGQREVTSAIAVACATAVWFVVRRPALFEPTPVNELLLLLLSFNSMVVTTGLVLVVALRERGPHREGAIQPAAGKSGTARERLPLPAQPPSAGAAGGPSLESQLHRAIERQEFVLHYQPKVDLSTREVVGLEALLRWSSPERGLVPPASFVPLLEESGMILEVGAWVLRRAIRDQAAWAAQGMRVPRVAVNVSAIQLRRPDFVGMVQQALEPGSDPRLIELEITESRIMENIDANITKLTAIRELGVGVTIDDFGTGYSSLFYLAKLPVQALKIDRSFIARMLDDDEMMAVVQTIISLGQSLNRTTVAEGVEQEAQADLLELLRCDQIQGYLVSPPRPRDEINRFLPMLPRN